LISSSRIRVESFSVWIFFSAVDIVDEDEEEEGGERGVKGFDPTGDDVLRPTGEKEEEEDDDEEEEEREEGLEG